MTNRYRDNLKIGFTTGTAAAAAAKAALTYLLCGIKPSGVKIQLLNGNFMDIPVCRCVIENSSTATCSVIKDAGDDPDITHRAEIGARIVVAHSPKHRNPVEITGGKGVGHVTKPGLEVPVGEPAINPGPRKMITQAISEVLAVYPAGGSVTVEIFVPEGEKLASKTLNPRLGILGGISILGTTGIVRPMSHDAYIATIKVSLSVAHASGTDRVVLTTGRRSERFARKIWSSLKEEAFIQMGDFFKLSIEAAATAGFRAITLAAFFGKALKMAQGIAHTHAAKSRLTMRQLSDWAWRITCDAAFAEQILSANTARHAYEMINGCYPELIGHVGNLMIGSAQRFAGPAVDVQGVIFDFDGQMVYDSENMET